MKQLLEDPERCHVVLHFLQDADLELPDGARLKRIMQGDLSAAREALKDRRPTLEAPKIWKRHKGLPIQRKDPIYPIKTS